MATLATVTPLALVTMVAPLAAPSLGTGMYNLSELHGNDFKFVRSSILETRKRNQELSESILGSEPEHDFAYTPLPPLRSFFIDVTFERGGEIQPIPFELDEDSNIG